MPTLVTGPFSQVLVDIVVGMNRTRHSGLLRRLVLLISAVLIIGALCAYPLIAMAQPSAEPQPSGSSQPVYPSASPSSETDDKGTIAIPSVTSQEGKMYLAVTDAAIDDVDSQKIMDAVREAVDGQNAKILLGVDKKPNNLKGASQLVRGMLLFGNSDAMSDDWLENGKTKGYVGQGWIAIGVMLPETKDGDVEVFVDPGRNVRETEPGSKDRILDAGAPSFEAGDYTAGISAVAISTTENLRAPLDKKIAVSIVVGVLLLIAAVIVFFALRGRRRAQLQAAARKRIKQVEVWESSMHQDLNALRRTPMNDATEPALNRSAATIKEIQRQREQAITQRSTELESALDASAEPQISEQQAHEIEQRAERLSLLRRAVELARSLSGTASNSVKSWNQIIEQHHGGLKLLVQLLDTDGATALPVTPQVRTAIVTHTDALDQLQARAKTKLTEQEAAHLLEELWALREELDSLIDQALAQSQGASMKVDAKLAEQLRAFLPRAGANANDPISVLRTFAPSDGQH